MVSVGRAASYHQEFVAIFLSLCSHFIFDSPREMRLLQSLEMLDNKQSVTQHCNPKEQISTAMGDKNPHCNIMLTLGMSGAVPLQLHVLSQACTGTINLLLVQFKSLLPGQEGCVFFSGHLNVRKHHYALVR
jgi:hypothetical protein